MERHSVVAKRSPVASLGDASLPRLAPRAPLRGRGDVRWLAGRANRDGGQVIRRPGGHTGHRTIGQELGARAAHHKRTQGPLPMCAFIDHGEQGTGEPLVLNSARGRLPRETRTPTSPPSTSPWSNAQG